MAKFDETFDYFQILDLDAGAMSAYGVKGLKKVIKDKKKEWTSQAVNPLYQQEARSNLERVGEFEKVLDEPEAMRAYVNYMKDVQAARREQQEREVGRLVQVAVAGRKRLTTHQLDLLFKEAEKDGIVQSVVDAVVERLGIKIEAGESAAGTPGLPYKSPAMDATLLTQINNWLKVLDIDSLYALLDLPQRTSAARLVAVAERMYERWSKVLPKTSECVAWEKSLQACLSYLKDPDEKSRYDRALFNQRIDNFVRRVDLLLAGGRLTRDQQVLLNKVGVREFGLSSTVVNNCVKVRAAASGVSIGKPVAVTLQMQEQSQCTRCFSWNPIRNSHCWQCSSSLNRLCENPSCRKKISAELKMCEHCQLPISKSRFYAELVKLADNALNQGDFETAFKPIKQARQILPSEEIDDRLARAGRIRSLTASYQQSIANKSLTSAHAALAELVRLAPNYVNEEFPTLEDINVQIVRLQSNLTSGLPDDADAIDRARLCLEILSDWSDCEQAARAGFQVVVELASHKRIREAFDVACKLQPFCGRNMRFQKQFEKLEELLQIEDAANREREQTAKKFTASMREKRFYAAEKALKLLDELGGSVPEEQIGRLHEELKSIRAEIAAIQHLADESGSRDEVIQRYRQLLDRCRDCREALTALQNTQPDAPQPPSDVTIGVDGNFRRVSWSSPEDGQRPDEYIVERSLVRAGSTNGESNYKTVYRGTENEFVDTEIIHNGSIVRYTVQSLRCSRLEVGGDLLREFEVPSTPTNPITQLIWQEVMGFRCIRRSDKLELRWHQPAGARQALVERWNGGPDDDRTSATLLTPTNNGLLIDKEVEPEQLYSYRVFCIYDGADGDFATPGTTATDALKANASALELEDVENLQAGIDGRSIHLTWTWPEGCQRVHLYRRYGLQPDRTLGEFDRRWQVTRKQYGEDGITDNVTADYSGEVYYRAFTEFQEDGDTLFAPGNSAGAQTKVELQSVETTA